jgi:hypothetical protein
MSHNSYISILFFRPNELDASVFSHVHILTTSNIPPSMQELATIIRSYPNLIQHTYLINEYYFNRTPNLRANSFELIEISSEESIMKAFNCD